MERLPTGEDGLKALRDHVVERAAHARLKYGLYIDHEAVVRMLDDREVVRYPTGLRFDAHGLEPGEFAAPMAIGADPERGFCLLVHPWFEQQREIWPLLIAYHIPSINYGEIVTHVEAELFGATLLGIDVDAYYQALCELADSMPA
jgi:hypothetical protein